MRTRATAKAAGTRFERSIADHLAITVSRYIDRAPKTGAADKGDLLHVESSHGHKIAVECKDTAKINLAGHAAEAEAERVNLGAIAGIVVHKRHGKGEPGLQWVTMTVDDLVAILTGVRP